MSNVVFFCQSCGARFDVDAKLSGKKARCKKCGQVTVIPRPNELESMVAVPVAEPGGARPAKTGASDDGPGVASWLATAPSSVALAPLTVDRMPGLRRETKPTPLDGDDEGSALYKVVIPRREQNKTYTHSAPARLKALWRGEIRSVQRPLRWLNDTAYLISIPFLSMILIGAILRNRPIALLGATVVVLLNVARLATGLFNLALVPFKDSLVRGLLFLIPPFTVIDLSTHWHQLKKPAKRVIEPAVTLGLVVLAFTFLPSLSAQAPKDTDIVDRLKGGATSLEKDIEGEVKEAKTLDLKKFGDRAKDELGKINEGVPDAPAPKAAPGGGPAGGAAAAIKDYADQVRESAGPP